MTPDRAKETQDNLRFLGIKSQLVTSVEPSRPGAWAYLKIGPDPQGKYRIVLTEDDVQRELRGTSDK